MSAVPLNGQLAGMLNRAIALHERGDFQRAESAYRQLTAVAPRSPEVCECYGVLLQQTERAVEAMRWFIRACQLDERRVSSSVRLTWALTEAGRLTEAQQVSRRLTEKMPNSAPAWNALGYATKLCGRMAEARACHVRAVTLDPKYADGWYHLGLVDSLVGSNVAALEHFAKALALNPRFDDVHYGRAQALLKLFRIEEAVAEFDVVLRKNPAHLDARSYRLFGLQSLEISRERLFAEHQAYGQLCPPAIEVPANWDLNPERRLRLGILSPDLRTHSCAYFLEPLLARLDPAGFEVYLYHDHFVEDDMSARLKALAVQWRNFVGQPGELVERTIRTDRIDVLVDLAAHVSNAVRLPVLARRVAPVQITYLGYPDTTGVPAMDFRFTDGVADSEGVADAFATEKLVRFSSVAWCYRPPVEAGPVVPPPATVSTDVPITFGCFNSPTKFSGAVIRAWGQILERVPGSRLVLKGRDFEAASVREYLLKRLTDAGVSAERVVLLPRTATIAEHLAQYAQIDLALDTFPYGGTTTTCEALWMGRPVVTLCGDRHAARVGASLLTAIERPKWIAQDVDEYVRLAVSLAANRAELKEHSMRLREAMQSSPLLDHSGQAARFGAALRACWKERVARLIQR